MVADVSALDAQLPTIWALVMAFAILVYVVLDGFDLGVGILFGTNRDQAQRHQMMAAIAPVWDGNETWLLVVAAGLYAAFPMVYAIFLPAFYLPVVLLLIGLIFRGVAFEFRHQGGALRRSWDLGFFVGSLVVTFVQGTAIGALVTELPVEAGRFVGGPFVWLTPFALWCGLGLVAGYALLGATWLVLKTEGPLRDWAYRRVPWLLAAVLAFLAMAFVGALMSNLRVMDRWLDRPVLLILPAIGALAVACLALGIRFRRDYLPFAMTVVIFAAAFAAMAGSFWPHMIPFSVTIEQAAAPAVSLRFLSYGVFLIIPVILLYTGYVYWVFRGKIRPGADRY